MTSSIKLTKQYEGTKSLRETAQTQEMSKLLLLLCLSKQTVALIVVLLQRSGVTLYNLQDF